MADGGLAGAALRMDEFSLGSSRMDAARADIARIGADAADAAGTAGLVVMNVRMVGGMMGEINRSMGEISGHVTACQQGASQAIAESRSAAERLAALEASVAQIASVAGLIKKIARQTDMLALNAMIEAAHAGAAGRGFSVVANEVKDLSRQTTEAADRIGSELTAIAGAAGAVSNSVGSARDSVAAMCGQIDGIEAAVREHAGSCTAIDGYASEAAESVESITVILDAIAARAGAAADRLAPPG